MKKKDRSEEENTVTALMELENCEAAESCQGCPWANEPDCPGYHSPACQQKVGIDPELERIAELEMQHAIQQGVTK